MNPLFFFMKLNQKKPRMVNRAYRIYLKKNNPANVRIKSYQRQLLKHPFSDKNQNSL